jgi:Ca-activated chloride channel homolog
MISQSDDNLGLFTWLENTRIRLPLRAVDFHFSVIADLADVTVSQIFHNQQAHSVAVQYTFPMPADSAVYRCEMIVDGTIIEAVAKRTEDAREDYKRAVAAGHQAALVESVHSNVFELNLGNVPAGRLVVLRLSYITSVERMLHSASLRLPTAVSEKYVPGTPLLRPNQGTGTTDDTDAAPDASRLSPPRIDELHPDCARVSITGTFLGSEIEPLSLLCPTHPTVIRQSGDLVHVQLGLDKPVPSEDFILRWKPAPLAPGSGTACTGYYRNAHIAIGSMKAPVQHIGSHSTPREVWFLVDRSSSMRGGPWAKACEAVQTAVANLPDDTRVGVVLFSSSPAALYPQPRPAFELRYDPQFTHMIRQGAVGGTEMISALRYTADHFSDHASRRVGRTLIIITDGAVANDEQIRRELLEAMPATVVHTIGIAVNVNDGLLKDLADSTQGTCVMLNPQEDVSEAVLTILRHMSKPFVTRLNCPPPHRALRLSSSLAQDIVSPFILETPEGATPPTIEGTLTDGSLWRPHLSVFKSRTPGVVLKGVREKIAIATRNGDQAAAIELALRFNLLCDGVAFVAVDRNTRSPVAPQRIIQPNIERHETGNLMSETICFRTLAGGPSFSRTDDSRIDADYAIRSRNRVIVGSPSPRMRQMEPNPFLQTEFELREKMFPGFIECLRSSQSWNELCQLFLIVSIAQNWSREEIQERIINLETSLVRHISVADPSYLYVLRDLIQKLSETEASLHAQRNPS